MTVAALAATTLDRCLRDHRRQRPGGDLDGFGRRFQRQLAKVNAAPWLLATGEDLRYPETEGAGRDWTTRLMQRYVDRVMYATPRYPEVALAFAEVISMVSPPSRLLSPGILARVLRPAA